MRRINKYSFLLIGVLSFFLFSFDWTQPSLNDKTTVQQSGYSLEGTSFWIRTDDYYFTLDFTSDRDVVQYGYYIVDGEGYGAWGASYLYSFDENRDIFILMNKRDMSVVGEFNLNSDDDGNIVSMVLRMYNMEPGGETQCELSIK